LSQIPTFGCFLQCSLGRLPGFEGLVGEFRGAPVRVARHSGRHAAFAVAAGFESEWDRSQREIFSTSLFLKLFATIICFLEDVGLIIFCALEPYRLSGALSEDLFLERKLQQQPQLFNSLSSTPRIPAPACDSRQLYCLKQFGPF
jgi:hypothetical protein